MPPVSKMRRLPPAVLDEVNKLFADGMSVEDVAHVLQSAGHAVSTAGVGRYRKWWSDHVEPTLAFRAMLEATAPNLIEKVENRTGLLNLEVIQMQLAEALSELKDTELTIKKRIEILMDAAIAQAKLSTARRDEITGMVKLEDYKAAIEAKEGELLKKQDGKLVRVEFVEAKATVKAAGEGEAVVRNYLTTEQETGEQA